VTAVAEPTAAPAPTDAGPTTLPGWLLAHAEQQPNHVAIRVKELGRWREITWAEYAERVQAVGRALLHQGLKAGDRVAIVSDNRAEWLIVDLAVQGLGAVSVGIPVTGDPSELAAMIERTHSDVVVVEDEEQFDKLMETSGRVSPRQIVVVDPRGIERLDSPSGSFEALEALGSRDAIEARKGDLDAWRRTVAELDPSSVATIVFTPGVAHEPKGVLLSHANLLAAAEGAVQALGLTSGDEIVSTLPLWDIIERGLAVAQAVRAGATVHFGEGGVALTNDIREVQPTVFVAAPRVWEHFYERVTADLRIAGRVKRVSLRMARRNKSGPVAWVGRAFVTRRLRKHLGLGRTRIAVSATAPAQVEVVKWWRSVGVPLCQAYGLTEAAGIVTVGGGTTPEGSVGRAIPGVELQISGEGGAPSADAREGEVLVRGPVVSTGYLDDSDATAASVDRDGWLHTGDVGRLDDGALSIVGREGDAFATADGTHVAPRPIESRLEASPDIRYALVVGEGRPCIGALLSVDPDEVGDWAAEKNVPFTTFRSLVERPEVHDLLKISVDEANEGVDPSHQVQRFALIREPLAIEDGVLTASFKLRRRVAEQHYRALIDEMYASQPKDGAS
jgi:long-chain acyl-CoA synthetase